MWKQNVHFTKRNKRLISWAGIEPATIRLLYNHYSRTLYQLSYQEIWYGWIRMSVYLTSFVIANSFVAYNLITDVKARQAVFSNNDRYLSQLLIRNSARHILRNRPPHSSPTNLFPSDAWHQIFKVYQRDTDHRDQAHTYIIKMYHTRLLYQFIVSIVLDASTVSFL